MKGKTNGAGTVFRAIGMMSGTSLDGVDAAELRTDGETIFGFGDTTYRAYSDSERGVLRRALGAWPGEACVAEAAELVETAHASVLSRFGPADVVGFHGQTLAHDPDNNRTHQAGDGNVLALASHRKVVWDFRTNDVSMGGQGAPLAPAYHFALAKWLALAAPVGVLNLGGVANITLVDPTCAAPEGPGALLACDTGPANAPLDDLIRARTNQKFDTNGALAAAGTAYKAILQRLRETPYLSAPWPKSLDRDSFAWLTEAVKDLSLQDAAATLTDAIALSVAEHLNTLPDRPEVLLVTGGGRRNPSIMAALRQYTECDVKDIDETGLNGDMLEAQAFAFLAVRVMRGLPTSFPGTTGVSAAIGGGQVSDPVTTT